MKLRVFIYIYFLVVFFSTGLVAQVRDTKELNPDKKNKLANNLIKSGSYYNAIDYLLELAKQNPKNEKYLFRLADAYFLSRDYKNAELWYQKIVVMEKKTSIALYKYGQSLKYNGKYKEALEAFKKFSQAKLADKEAAKFKGFAKNEMQSCQWAMDNSSPKDMYKINHLGDNVNSAYSEFGPVLMNDSTLIFSSIQSDSVIKVEANEAHSFHVKLMASKKENEEWGEHEELPTVNTTFENNGNGTFSTDGKRFYFTRCLPDNNQQMICEIYVSEVINGVFQKAEKLSSKINIDGYTATQPHIATVAFGAKKSEVLFYVSNRPGGRGGMDIWYTTFNKDGSIKMATNAGNVINTPGDEITPFYQKETSTLYFSSNYHFGYGGFDVFKSSGNTAKWSKPANVGKPVNSRVDDTYYTLSDYRNGFVVSNRPEGYHLLSETCCDDIYAVSVGIPLILTVEAFSAKDSSLPVDAKFVVIAKSKKEKPLLYKDNDVLTDSALNVLRNKHHSYIYQYYQSIAHQTIQTDSTLSAKEYTEVEKGKDYYSLHSDSDYVIFGIGKHDTSVFMFRISEMHDLLSEASSDSLTNSKLKRGAAVDIMKIRFYLDADSLRPVPVATVDTIETIEDEKVLTVTKFIKDIKENNTNNLKIILNYDFNDEQFIKTHSPSLDSLADLMKAYPDIKINISAHTDNRGTEEYNMDLSKRRARSIEHYLIKKGIEKKRMVSSWYGESLPLAPNSNPDGSDNPWHRHLNRRAEITLQEER